MLHILLTISPVFLLIATGYTLKQWFIRNETFWSFSEKLTCNLLAPLLFMLIVNKADFSASGISTAIIATISATFTVVALLFLTKFIVRVNDSLFTSIFQGGLRSNSYIFLAMASLLYNETGLAIAGVFVACTLVLSNIVLILVVSGSRTKVKRKPSVILKALLQNPLILGTLMGLLLNLIGIQLTDTSTATKYLHYLGDAATPLNLLSVGAGLSLTIKWQKITATAYATSLKLIIMPVLTALLLKFFGVTGTAAGVAMLYAATPCAGNAYTISRKIGGDSEAMGAIITWTTLASMITIAFLVGIVR